jgi:uncharacterized protein (TIGR02246 family)
MVDCNVSRRSIMTKCISILILLIGFAGLLSAAEPGVGETGKAWVQAFSRNDLEAVVALYAPDAHMFPPDTTEAVGIDAIRANYANLMNTFTIKQVIISDAHHETVGDLSFAWGLYSVTLVPKAGGDAIRMDGRFSDVSRKINGKWLYIVDHASAAPAAALPPSKQ